MAKKKAKNILSDFVKGCYITGLGFNMIFLIVSTTMLCLAILTLNMTSIVDEYFAINSTISENLLLFYSILYIVNIMSVYILNLISVILGIIGYKFNNKIVKIIAISLSVVAFLLILLIGRFVILLALGVCMSLSSLYFEKKLEEKKKNN